MSIPESAKQVLKHLRLSEHMVTVKDSPHYCDVRHLHNESVFKSYSSASYRNNKELKEMDEVYRFSTHVYLHLASGIRCEYAIHDIYIGGDEYKLDRIFVITNENEELDVLDADFIKETVVTSRGAIPFVKLKRRVEKTD